MKHLGVLESNLSGSGFEGLRVAKKLGMRVTFFSRSMDRYLATPGGPEYFDKYVDEIVVCETNELAPALDRVLELQEHRPFSGFMTLGEYDVVVAAEIAAALGLPTPHPDGIRTARNKAHMRRRCAERGVPMPAFRAVTSAEEAADAATAVGFPCVVKPADETSSADVRRCTSVEEVVEHFNTIRSRTENSRGQRRHHEIMVEECILGFEVSVEVLAAGTRFHVFGVTDKLVGGHNRFVELGHIFPSVLPDHIRVACEQVAIDALLAVGFDLGMAHVEVKYTAQGAKLIEINPRPAGDRITDLVDIGLDTSCLEFVVRQYLGEHVDDDVPTAAVRGVAIRYLTADPGQVTAVTGTEVAARIPGIRKAVTYVKPGDRVNPLLRNGDRVGYVLAVADDPYVAARTADAAAHEIAVLTTEAGR